MRWPAAFEKVTRSNIKKVAVVFFHTFLSVYHHFLSSSSFIFGNHQLSYLLLIQTTYYIHKQTKPIHFIDYWILSNQLSPRSVNTWCLLCCTYNPLIHIIHLITYTSFVHAIKRTCLFYHCVYISFLWKDTPTFPHHTSHSTVCIELPLNNHQACISPYNGHQLQLFARTRTHIIFLLLLITLHHLYTIILTRHPYDGWSTSMFWLSSAITNHIHCHNPIHLLKETKTANLGNDDH